jgi:cytochrome c biogenesis protein CcdA
VFKLAITVVAIALPDCINPSLIGGELLVAVGDRPRRRTAVFTVAAWIVTFVVGLVLLLGLGDLILSFLPKPGATVKYSLITAAGLVLVLAGAMIWIRRRSLASSEDPPGEAAASHHGKTHGSAALMGAGIAGVELLTAFPYFAAIALIVGSGVSNPAKVSLLALYCVVYVLPLITIALTVALMGKRADAMLAPLGRWFMANWPAVVGPLTAGLGAFILVFGVIELTTV